MIVVVEGPSAAGKTTWCRLHAGRFVAEHSGSPSAEPGDGQALARYWARVSMSRWSEAEALEQSDGIAFCDGDPVKLHYSWGMAYLGLAPKATFDRELAVIRAAFATSRLGFADAVLLSTPDEATLRLRRDTDPTRRRRNFATHVQLTEPLRLWYETLDALDPGRVTWDLPATGTPALPPPRADRCSPDLLDALLEKLPAL